MKAFYALCCFLAAAILSPALSAGEWFTDFEAAKAESAKTGRPIYMLFSNPDSAISLSYDRNIFKQKKFMDYADSKLVLMKVEFPVAIHKQKQSLRTQNARLKSEYSVTVMPVAFLVDSNGALFVDFVGADGGMEKHRRKLNEVMDFNPPKRYTEYLDKYVKNYKPPKAEPKKTEAVEAAKPTKASVTAKSQSKPSTKKPAKKPADGQTRTDGTVIIPDEDAGRPLVPLDPEGDFQDWLKSATEEVAAEADREIEEAKEAVEEAKEAVEEADKANAQAEASGEAQAPAAKE